MAADEVLKYIATNEIKWVDLQFFDITGFLNKATISHRDVEEYMFTKGVAAADLEQVFGKSEQGELVLLPDDETIARLPWEPSTIRLLCDVVTAIDNERYLKDSRYIAHRAQTNLEALGIKTSRVGASVEFYIMDTATTDRTAHGRGSGTIVDSRESFWSPSPLSSVDNTLTAQPYDSMYAARVQISETLEDTFGYAVDSHRHGRGKTAHQSVDIKEYGIKTAGDAFSTLKFVVRNLANAVNAAPTFMPYPIEGERGSSLNISMSLWKTADNNVFYDGTDEYAQLSQTGRYFIGGLLEHAASLSLFTMPLTNSYKHLAVESRVVAWSKLNKKTVVNVPHVRKNYKEGKRIVYTAADPSVNPYLSYASVMSAGLDGIKNKIDPGDPLDEEGEEVKKRKWNALPNSLYAAMEAFESDPKYIKGVIPQEFLDAYIDLKISEHQDSLRSVSPWELERYWNV